VYACAVEGKIAVVMRGDISFVEKAQQAQKAKAAALIIVNTDDTLVLPGEVALLCAHQGMSSPMAREHMPSVVCRNKARAIAVACAAHAS
jgi:hypothetical protein